MNEPLFKPYSLMQTRDGSLYGATFSGHKYQMTTDGIILRLFNWPDSPCLETRDGVLYGATANNVWRANPDGGSTSLHILDRATEGESITCVVESRDGPLYGMAESTVGGAGYGTIFRMLRDGTFTVIHRFDGTDGEHPTSALVEGLDGQMYGTSTGGGEFGAGTLFRVTPTGGFALLHSFTGTTGTGDVTGGPLVVGRDGAIYGLTTGCLFRVSPENPTLVQWPVCGFAINSRWSSIFAGSDGSFYVAGGSFIHRIMPDGTYVLLADLPEGIRALIHGRDGNIYGVATYFGLYGSGYVFRVSNPTSCDATMHVDYNSGILELRFTLKTTTPALWGVWVATPSQLIPLWTVVVPSITPAVFFSVPLSPLPLPDLGVITISTVLLNRDVGVCVDRTAIDTSVGVGPP